MAPKPHAASHGPDRRHGLRARAGPGFGTGGRLVTRINNSLFARAMSVAIQEDDNIVMAGMLVSGATPRQTVLAARYLAR